MSDQIRHKSAWQRAGFLGLLVLSVAVWYLLPAGPVAWATPPQSRLRQTVPTLAPPRWSWVGGSGPYPVDYAPSGMPDFDQQQSDWHDGASPETWTHSGPVAAADVIWWFDSLAQGKHDLLPSFGGWDDHDAQNVIPLVSGLAARLGTNSVISGTDVFAFAPAFEEYITGRGLQDVYSGSSVMLPTFEQLHGWIVGGNGVVLLLGFWEQQGPEQWVYLGGHYVAAAGVEPVNRYLAVSDPFRDAFEAAEILLGRSDGGHAYPHGSEVHNDAKNVSHDAYRVVVAEGPGGVVALADYAPTSASLPSLFGQNMAAAFEDYRGDYVGPLFNVWTTIDYAIVLTPPPYYHLYIPIIVKEAR